MRPDAETRRSVSEWVTYYEFEPSLRDVFVEGADDKHLIDAWVESAGLKYVGCFEVGSVSFGDQPLQSGNRSRVIELSKALSKSSRRLTIACVIDMDFDSVVGEGLCEINRHLYRTDHSCLEAYFFSDEIRDLINRYCLRSRKISDVTWSHFIPNTLRSMFVIRLLNDRPYWKVGVVPVSECVSFRQNTFSFDLDQYIRKFLSKKTRMRDFDRFWSEYRAVSFAEIDIRSCFNGHDYRELLAYVLNKLLGSQRYDQDSVFDLLKIASGVGVLSDSCLFIKLKQLLQR